MSPTPRYRCLLALAAAMAVAAPGGAGADQTAPVAFHRIADDAATLAFATRFFYKHYPNPPNWSFGARFSRHENWSGLTRERGYMALADIAGDGAHDLMLLVDSPDWCDDRGCLGAIFRPTPRGYEYICEAALQLEGTMLLAQTENGYRVVATDGAIIHWGERQAFDSGSLCDVEER